jgi:uncharacterized OsmC-like protein
MNRNTQIRLAQEDFIATLSSASQRPLSTSVTRGHVEEGLVCQVVQGRHRAVMDLGTRMGGDNAGPTPSFYARAGIVGCVAIGIKMTAAREGLDFRRVDVEVETDFDDGALVGIGSSGAAPVETRVSVTIDTDADLDTVQALVQKAMAMDPWYLALRDAQQVRIQAHILATA